MALKFFGHLCLVLVYVALVMLLISLSNVLCLNTMRIYAVFLSVFLTLSGATTVFAHGDKDVSEHKDAPVDFAENSVETGTSTASSTQFFGMGSSTTSTAEVAQFYEDVGIVSILRRMVAQSLEQKLQESEAERKIEAVSVKKKLIGFQKRIGGFLRWLNNSPE